MSSLRIVLLAVILLASAHRAIAAPIAFNGGMLDGTLKFYTVASRQSDLDPASTWTFTLGHEYVLGIDFFPAVPIQFLSALLPYSACTDGPVKTCSAQGHPISSSGWFDQPLGDGCGAFDTIRPDLKPIAIVARGNCAFADKWDHAETGGFGGILVGENDPAAVVGAFAFPNPFLPTVTIPFMRVTKQVLTDMSAGTPLFTNGTYSGTLFPFVEMRVSWTPDEHQVPEPTPFMLVGVGVVGAVVSRYRSRG